MTRPDFTTWLRGLEPPESEWRPHSLRGSIGMMGVTDLLNWIGQGYGRINATDLLDAVRGSCDKRQYNPNGVYIVAYKRDGAEHPFEVRNDVIFHPSSDADQITIYFAPIKEGM